MKTLVYLFLAIVSAIVFAFCAYASIEAWNHGTDEADAIKAAYTGETKGKKVAQESYLKYFPRPSTYYRATFVYEVDGETYQMKTDTGIELWDEEEVHYDVNDPAKCYVGQYPPMEDESTDYWGPAAVAFVMAIVFGAGVLGFY